MFNDIRPFEDSLALNTDQQGVVNVYGKEVASLPCRNITPTPLSTVWENVIPARGERGNCQSSRSC